MENKKHNLFSETINSDMFNIIHPVITDMVSKVYDKVRFMAF